MREEGREGGREGVREEGRENNQLAPSVSDLLFHNYNHTRRSTRSTSGRTSR